MKKLYILFLSVCLSSRLSAQEIVLFEQSFITPNQPLTDNCAAPDFDITEVNVLWGSTATGTGGGGLWNQIYTVETININGPSNQYQDPQGLAGDYCIGMLSELQDDRVSLVLNTQMLPYVNFSFMISTIDVNGCGGPFGVAKPVINIKVFDAPGGTYDFSNGYTLLDEWTIEGVDPGPTPYTFNWATRNVAFNVANATNGNIAVVWDLLASPYAAIDNIKIVSSETPSGLIHPSLNQAIYPNPVKDVLYFSYATNQQLRLSNALGQIVWSQILNSPRIDISSLANGIYFLHDADGRVCKIVKE